MTGGEKAKRALKAERKGPRVGEALRRGRLRCHFGLVGSSWHPA